jgi:hypothetical protein
MPSDLDLIEQLEQEIKIELIRREFEEISISNNVGFSIDENSTVTGLNLDNTNSVPLPPTLRKFQNLKRLHLENCGINDTCFLKDLSNLASLYLNNNDIKDISTLKKLTHLTALELRQNKILDISHLRELIHLKTLDLRMNKIIEIPKALFDLKMEADIDSFEDYGGLFFLRGNPLEKPPLEIIRKGKGAIKAYFEILEKEDKQTLNEAKVILVGDGGVGKTSLMNLLLGEGFDKNESQTQGIDIKSQELKVGKSGVITHFWDFGGQEIMHATHQFFLSKRSLYILVLDGRRDEKNEYWLKHIESFGGDSPVLVVLNKIDQNPGFDVNRKFLQGKYKNIKGFSRISCATKEGIEMFSASLGQSLTDLELLHTTWPGSWFKVKIKLETMSEDFISYEQYKEICSKEKIDDEDSQDTLLDFLNDLGVVLHFRDLELEDTHVLDPEWVTTAVYKIINSKEAARTQGLLNLKQLDNILKKNFEDNYNYPKDKYSYIIKLMEKFELCYRIDDETVLIPDLLAVPEPHFDFNYDSALKFIVEYDFLPRSIMPRFIVKMHRDVKNMLCWRTGVVLTNDDFESSAVIKSDNEAKRIYIYVMGARKRDYFAVIRHTLKTINDSFEKIEIKELIPLPDDHKITVSYKHLARLEKEGIEYYFPGELENNYRVQDLLGSITVKKSETMQTLSEIKLIQIEKETPQK